MPSTFYFLKYNNNSPSHKLIIFRNFCKHIVSILLDKPKFMDLPTSRFCLILGKQKICFWIGLKYPNVQRKFEKKTQKRASNAWRHTLWQDKTVPLKKWKYITKRDVSPREGNFLASVLKPKTCRTTVKNAKTVKVLLTLLILPGSSIWLCSKRTQHFPGVSVKPQGYYLKRVLETKVSCFRNCGFSDVRLG